MCNINKESPAPNRQSLCVNGVWQILVLELKGMSDNRVTNSHEGRHTGPDRDFYRIHGCLDGQAYYMWSPVPVYSPTISRHPYTDDNPCEGHHWHWWHDLHAEIYPNINHNKRACLWLIFFKEKFS